MAKDLRVRRKHLQRAFKQIDGTKVRLSHIKDQTRCTRANTVIFFDDNTGETHILKLGKDKTNELS